MVNPASAEWTMSNPTTETSLALAAVDFEAHTCGSWVWSESELSCLKSAHSRARDLLKVLGGPRAGAGSWLQLIVETSTLIEQKPQVNIFSYVFKVLLFYFVSSFQKINIFLLFYFYFWFLIFVFVSFFFFWLLGLFCLVVFLFMFLLFVFVFIIFLGFWQLDFFFAWLVYFLLFVLFVFYFCPTAQLVGSWFPGQGLGLNECLVQTILSPREYHQSIWALPEIHISAPRPDSS